MRKAAAADMHGNGARRLRPADATLPAALAICLALAGCGSGQSTASLPEITKPAVKPLTPDQQKAAVQELTRQRDAQQAEAEKQTAKTK